MMDISLLITTVVADRERVTQISLTDSKVYLCTASMYYAVQSKGISNQVTMFYMMYHPFITGTVIKIDDSNNYRYYLDLMRIYIFKLMYCPIVKDISTIHNS